MKIIGSVCSDVKYSKGTSKYKIIRNEQEYEVVSFGKQAIKDFIFIKNGQKVEMNGNIVNKKIFPVKEKILLQIKGHTKE